MIESISRKQDLVRRSTADISSSISKQAVQAIAFYLPQFHPIAANDEWWGEGFTEWANVGQARSLHDDHARPSVPTDLGYYDLRLASTYERQVELAREYGLAGFCMYLYWFAGERLLNEPLDRLLNPAAPDFPTVLLGQ